MVKTYIVCGRIDKKLTKFIILASINEILLILYQKYLSEPKNVNNIIDIFTRTIGEILGGALIPYIIKHKKHYYEQLKIKQIIKQNYLLWIINAFVFGSNILLINFVNKSGYYKPVLSTPKAMEMLIFLLITLFLMKYTYYRHHYSSMAIFVISCVLIDIFVNYFSELKVKVLFIYLYFLFYSVMICHIKYLMDFKYKNYWDILLSIGLSDLFSFILYIIILLIYQHIKGHLYLIDDLKSYYKNVENKFIIIRSFAEFVFFGIYYPIIRFSFLKEFTPNHLLIGSALSSFIFNYIVFLIENRELYKIFIAGFFGMQCGSLIIYLELVENKCCGSNKNTKKNILLREENVNLYDDEDSIIDENIELSSGYLFKENKDETDENIKENEIKIDNMEEKEEKEPNEKNI